MQSHRHFNTLALLLFASAAFADLKPWHVTGLRTWQPSGRPGSDPHWYDYVNISNPDPTQGVPDTRGKVYCKIVWVYPDVPYNQVLDCEIVDTITTTPIPWAWTVELLMGDAGSYPVSNFDLRWRAASTEQPYGIAGDVEIWTGTGHFEAGRNLDYLCAASGFCSGALKAASTPFLINVTSVSCYGTLEEALHGINCD
ncbi:hypothetical protein F4861DRAFT_539348 [Xylaria intraflava]|nr:hypothetical protein F4861DRAFT_539348 [Xylaria intraflava]